MTIPLILLTSTFRLDKLVETISKKSIPDHQSNVIFEGMFLSSPDFSLELIQSCDSDM